MRVKICGVRTPDEAAAAAEAGADFVGIVFAASHRRVDLATARAIAAAVRPPAGRPDRLTGPTPGELSPRDTLRAWADAIDEALFRHRPLLVGVFADQPPEEVASTAAMVPLDLVQLSGGEADDRTAERLALPVIRAVHVGEQDDAERVAERVRSVRASLVLLDTADPQRRGGTGRAFPWHAARIAAADVPVLLAGGLTPANVARAIAEAGPWGVDVSSGVERDGRKDPSLMRAFVKAAKGGAR
ncbi:MAG: phosphoribosylanthranilate isomerase [Chloroflexota bacterium]|nr:phosphoribosylanthranilate isomerase [Dehalococcoidia bacterium]MDW8046782.1 phosphoribosylanthranilate isomerase [Chloroflexota bacterium]